MRLQLYADVAKDNGYEWSDFLALAVDNVTQTADRFGITGCDWRVLSELEDFLDELYLTPDGGSYLDAFEEVLEATL